MVLLAGAATFSLGFGPDSKKKRRTTYEYAAVQMVSLQGQTRSYFTGPDGTRTSGTDYVELCKKLGVKQKGSFGILLNHLGSKGWQFILTEDIVTQDGQTRLYYFKRTVR